MGVYKNLLTCVHILALVIACVYCTTVRPVQNVNFKMTVNVVSRYSEKNKIISWPIKPFDMIVRHSFEISEDDVMIYQTLSPPNYHFQLR